MGNFAYITRRTGDRLTVWHGTEGIILGLNAVGTDLGLHLSPGEARALAEALEDAADAIDASSPEAQEAQAEFRQREPRIVGAEPTPADPLELDARNIEYWAKREK